MFTWICPKCGSEVPPAYSDCPNCSQNAASPSLPSQTTASPSPASGEVPQTAPPPPSREPQQRPVDPIRAAFQALPPPQPAKKPALPGWAVMLLATAGLGLALAILYVYVLPSSQSRTAVSEQPALESPSAAAPAAVTQTNPLLKHLEVTGLRITEPKPQVVRIQFLVVNHSAADLPDMKGTVVLRNPKGEPVFEFPYNVPSIGPYESRDFSTEVKTKLRAYELPDWQLLRAELMVPAER